VDSDKGMREKRHWQRFGWTIPAGLFIGMGIGWLVGDFLPGLFIGLGIGIGIAGGLRARMKGD
jgi:hypothetical protein